MRQQQDKHGLSASQVEESRRQHGVNVLTPPKHTPLWKLFLEKFNDPLIKILLVALVLSVGIAIYEIGVAHQSWDVLYEPLGIFVAIVLATLVGFLVEVNANKKFRLLTQESDETPVKVVRDGHATQVPRRDIVVGDIVLLDTGDEVPADGQLLDGINIMVNESSFTGEPVAKKSPLVEDATKETTYPINVLLRGSTLTSGNGTMRVTGVGDATEYGKIYHDAQIETGVKTPLMLQLDSLGRIISWGSYIMAAILVVGRIVMLLTNGESESGMEVVHYLLQTVMLAVTLIVVAVPEGLPMSITLSLALSMRRMLHKNNLVRRMHACETMGAATVICTDKTGTLTENRMQVSVPHFYCLGDEATADAKRVLALSIACNSTAFLDDSNPQAIRALGNPTEGALLLWLRDRGEDYLALRNDNKVLSRMPFSTERKYMATVITDATSGKRLLLVKGAPEKVARQCSDIAGDDSWQNINAALAECQRKAMRTLAFAYRELDAAESPKDAIKGVESGSDSALTYLGFVAISDPVRADVPAAIQDCMGAGVKVKVVTGDTRETAVEIARQVGLWDDAEDGDEAVITGDEFAALTDEQAAQRVQKIKVMSRARPTDKARLVRLLQAQGEVVAVTGDGTNDAPALNAAQVGLSMGDGTAVAKEASDITILDNSFTGINQAVLWGRSLYRNIQRFILFQLTVNVCACLVVAVCSFFSPEPALTVTQMLWVNLIMDTFAALALASLPPNSIVMREKPRRSTDSVITRDMAYFIIGIGLVFAGILIAMFWHIVHTANAHEALAGINANIDHEENTIYFTTFVALQFWNLFNARAFRTGHTFFKNVKGSKLFFAVVFVIFIGQIVIVQVPYINTAFQCQHIDWLIYFLIFFCTSPVLLIGYYVSKWKEHQLRKTNPPISH